MYFNKIQCFCFEEQRLEPGEEVDMPVFFFIDPEILDDPAMDKLNSIILSYTFFKTGEEEVVTKSSSASSLPTSVEVEEVNVVSKRDAKDSIDEKSGSSSDSGSGSDDNHVVEPQTK